MAYVSSSEVKNYLKITSSTEDTLLAFLITAAQNYIEAQTETTFEVSADTTRYFDAIDDVDGRKLYLDAWLATTPTSITNGDGATISTSDVIYHPRRQTPYYAIEIKSSVDTDWKYEDESHNAIVVVGKFGYSLTASNEIKLLTLRLIHWLFRQRDNANDIDRTILVGDTVLTPAKLPNDINAMINRYKRTF